MMLSHHLYTFFEAGRRPDRIVKTWADGVFWGVRKIGTIFKKIFRV